MFPHSEKERIRALMAEGISVEAAIVELSGGCGEAAEAMLTANFVQPVVDAHAAAPVTVQLFDADLYGVHIANLFGRSCHCNALAMLALLKVEKHGLITTTQLHGFAKGEIAVDPEAVIAAAQGCSNSFAPSSHVSDDYEAVFRAARRVSEGSKIDISLLSPLDGGSELGDLDFITAAELDPDVQSDRRAKVAAFVAAHAYGPIPSIS